MPKKELQLAGAPIGLDARPDRLDLRDLPYHPLIENLPLHWPLADDIKGYLPSYIQAGLILNQGREGACTGFGLAATINYQLWIRANKGNKVEQVSPRMIYQLAKYYDEWPDEDYEGSSCRGALKGWQKHGVCGESFWPYDEKNKSGPQDKWDVDATRRPVGVYYRIDKRSVVDMQSAISRMGAIYVSASVHEGWSQVGSGSTASHGELPRIVQSKEILGGHAFCLVGYNEDGFIVQNSWGEDWGASGFAVLSYGDWVENGSDAWVVGLGVPTHTHAKSPQHAVRRRSSSKGATPVAGWLQQDDPQAGRSDVWSVEQAYQHTVVTGNNGVLLNRIPHLSDPLANAAYVAHELPAAALKNSGRKNLMLFLHGGLGSEESSIERIRILGRWLDQCGIYPLFLTWKSGWKEILHDLVEDKAHSQLGMPPAQGVGEALKEAWDRGIERLCRDLLVRSMWQEMKQNLEGGLSAHPKAGLVALADRLGDLVKEVPDLRIHIVGHSAGSIAAGHLLSRFPVNQLKAASCTLYAPACDISFALQHYKGAVDRGVLPLGSLQVHALTDKLEQGDSVGPYRQSLLYLVSRALEKLHKTPLLGMERAHSAAYATEEFWHADTLADLRAWQAFYGGRQLQVLGDSDVFNGARNIPSSHGCFDNSVRILADTVAAIADRQPNQLPKVVLDY
ncbi:C1 family peptidase [Pseudoduganella violaceinigra]|uniref:C1 family peptidase n=1 Tax=Pseudoduganella violaceinigra TaxID=246602 RepID=UPI00040AAD64|nr:C1 family peptidase [Pseudoduganella violaceinigra]